MFNRSIRECVLWILVFSSLGTGIVVAQNSPTGGENSLESTALGIRGVIRSRVLDSTNEIPLGLQLISESALQFGRPVVALAGGGFASAWLTGAPEHGLRIQWLDPAGQFVFQPNGRLVAGAVDAEVFKATMAAESTGGAFVGFTENSSIGSPMRVQFFDSAGNPQWPGVGALASSLDHHAQNIDLVPDDSGGVYACYTLGGTRGIWCQHLDAQGDPLWPAGGVLAGTTDDRVVLPRGVGDGVGGLLVFWYNYGDPDNGIADPVLVEGQRFSSVGDTLWGAGGLTVRETNFPEPGSVIGFSPDLLEVVVDGAGGAVVAFNDWLDQSTTGLDVIAQRIEADGNLPWGTGTPVAVGPVHYQHETTIGTGDGGAVVVVYEEIGSDRSRLRVYRLNAAGEHAWSAQGVELSDPASTALNYSAQGSYDHGTLRIAWTHQTVPGTLEMDVQLARFRGDGSRLDPPSGQTVTSVSDLQFCSGLAFSEASGSSLIVWDDRRLGDWNNTDVYGAELTMGSIFADGFESGDTTAW